jgi:hypothetical protein
MRLVVLLNREEELCCHQIESRRTWKLQRWTLLLHTRPSVHLFRAGCALGLGG